MSINNNPDQVDGSGYPTLSNLENKFLAKKDKKEMILKLNELQKSVLISIGISFAVILALMLIIIYKM